MLAAIAQQRATQSAEEHGDEILLVGDPAPQRRERNDGTCGWCVQDQVRLAWVSQESLAVSPDMARGAPSVTVQLDGQLVRLLSVIVAHVAAVELQHEAVVGHSRLE